MSEQTWTKEPWNVGFIEDVPGEKYWVIGGDSLLFARLPSNHPVMLANAERIVACVNYCAGIPTDVLTNYSPPAPVPDVVEAAREALIALNYARRFGSQGDIDFDENAGKSVSAYIDRAIDHLTAALSRHDAGGGQG
jgi:hypothetical protein